MCDILVYDAHGDGCVHASEGEGHNRDQRAVAQAQESRGVDAADEFPRLAGIGYEVEPGITAALACAAQFAIPLTQRGTARTLVLATGHTMDGDIDPAALCGAATTVALYMGTALPPTLCARLAAHGLAADMPAAIIFRGGSPGAEMPRATLAASRQCGPGLVLIGPAVARAWDSGKPEKPRADIAEMQ